MTATCAECGEEIDEESDEDIVRHRTAFEGEGWEPYHLGCYRTDE